MRVEKSFLKWMGGKSRLIPQLLIHFPKDNKNKRFIEPFVGAGNVFINTDYENYLLADSNKDLINVYAQLASDPLFLFDELENLYEMELEYYQARNMFNTSDFCVKRAALFIYLNRRCFNGVCRYNKNGQFNVPVGKHKKIYEPAHELNNFANKLRMPNVEFECSDYESTIDRANNGDVIYCDPPYLPLCDTAPSFNGYTPTAFDLTETKNLEASLYLAVQRGATAIVSNHDTDLVRLVFSRFEIHSVSVQRTIAANGSRIKAKEIIAVLTPDMI